LALGGLDECHPALGEDVEADAAAHLKSIRRVVRLGLHRRGGSGSRRRRPSPWRGARKAARRRRALPGGPAERLPSRQRRVPGDHPQPAPPRKDQLRPGAVTVTLDVAAPLRLARALGFGVVSLAPLPHPRVATYSVYCWPSCGRTLWMTSAQNYRWVALPSAEGLDPVRLHEVFANPDGSAS